MPRWFGAGGGPIGCVGPSGRGGVCFFGSLAADCPKAPNNVWRYSTPLWVQPGAAVFFTCIGVYEKYIHGAGCWGCLPNSAAADPSLLLELGPWPWPPATTPPAPGPERLGARRTRFPYFHCPPRCCAASITFLRHVAGASSPGEVPPDLDTPLHLVGRTCLIARVRRRGVPERTPMSRGTCR